MSQQSTPALPHLSSEMDTFFDLDQNDYTPTLSPNSSRSQSTMAHAGSASTSFASSSQPALSGPSHQYDAYRQQTGLPAGGLASTFAINQAVGMQYRNSSNGFVMPVETLNFPLPSNDDFDFNNPSYDMNDMDFDADSPAETLPTMFYPGKAQFVNPNALGGESSAHSPQVQRMYPGMHSQQAQAKAAQRKAQQELAHQHQQQQQRALEGQQPLPTPKPSRKNDPAVDERISRLLQQMRQNSTSSQPEDGEDSPGLLPQIQKMKKEEDEMDEDERLLASEEGKKLSSKERRQLRNKVSARAFRSRRKEYIGQLEGEIAAKTQESNDLRVQNRQLMEENARLTDLTRMLLSSPTFSGFLNELSVNGGSIPSALEKAVGPQQAPSQPHPSRKDVNPHHAARQLQQQQHQHQQVGMVMVPEPSVDFSPLDMNASNGWNSGVDMSSFQVFAVTAVPEGPVIDVNALSGKASDTLEVSSVPSKELPNLPSIPSFEAQEEIEEPEVNTDIELDESLSLFFDAPKRSAIKSSNVKSVPLISSPKPQTYELVVRTEESNRSAAAGLQAMCAELNALCARVESFTSHL